jgi:hypothetical protein
MPHPMQLAAPTPEEQVTEEIKPRMNGPGQHSPLNGGRNPNRRSVIFKNVSTFHYPPAVWNEDEESDHEDGDYDPYEGRDQPLNDTREGAEFKAQMEELEMIDDEDELMGWEDGSPAPDMGIGAGMGVGIGIGGTGMGIGGPGGIPAALQPGGMRVQQQQMQMQGQVQVQGGTRPLNTSPQPQAQQQAQQQLQQQQQQQRAQQGTQPLGLASQLRQQTSREQLSPADGPGQVQAQAQGRTTPSSPNDLRPFDPEDATMETKRINVTPPLAQDVSQTRPPGGGGGPQLPSEILLQQRQEQERAQSELAEHSRQMRLQQQQQQQQQLQQQQRGRDGKLTKLANNSPTGTSTSEDEKDKKKRGVFGSLFGGRKDKDKSKDVKASGKRVNEERPSDSSGGSSGYSPQDPRERERDYQGGIGDAPRGPQPTAAQAPPKSALSPHTRRLQEQDQALYQKYLHSSAKDASPQPSYATQSMGAYIPASGSSMLRANDGSVKARPGSLILTSPGLDGPGVPELNVIRVFAGTNLQTEATFKTALLNSSTTAGDLVRQAMQRFRIPAAEDEGDYFLTVKQQLEGSTTSLQPHERPLVVFEELVEAAEMPKVKRSSVGSISSVASNLSMHPAIKKLPMNDFTDDSTVKFYLNRRAPDGEEGSSERSTPRPGQVESPQGAGGLGLGRKSELSLLTAAAVAPVATERFTSPSTRFAAQLVIYPEDLPDGIVFDPHTEAIVPKSTLKERERAGVNPQPSPGIPMNVRRKVFMFPKNTTVAEVIELGLERFGISEGVVDGGDEVEDKLAKRRSQSRVRYGLSVQVEGQGGTWVAP